MTAFCSHKCRTLIIYLVYKIIIIKAWGMGGMDLYKLWLLVSWKDLSKREQYVKIRRSLVCVSNSGLCFCLGWGWGGEDSGLVTWTSSSKVILIFLGKKTESKVCKLKTCVIIITWNIPLKIINEFHTIYCLFLLLCYFYYQEWRFK